MTRPATRDGRALAARAVLAMAAAMAALVPATGGCGVDLGPEPAADRWASVASGADHTCAVSLDGLAYCWGDRSFSQLGTQHGSGCEEAACPWPVWVEETTGFTAIAAGLRHSCGIAERRAFCWGADAHGALGDGGLTTTPCPGQGEKPKCSATPRPVALGLPTDSIATSGSHSCALIKGGWAYCWGLNDHGQIGPDDGLGFLRLPRFIDSGARLAQISAGGAHTCAVAETGEALCWGAGAEGQLGTGSYSDSATPVPVEGGHSFSAIAAGGDHTCGIASGQVLCWGAAIAPTDTTVVVDPTRPRPVTLSEPVVQIAAGSAHTCAVGESGNVHCWGSNGSGQLGDGTATDSPEPVRATLPGPAARVSAGGAHTCALMDSGEIHCWGANDRGQLGTGTFGDFEAGPVRVGGTGAD